jgi:hypothetical protein
MNLSIIDTLNDKKLLGQFIKDPKTWKAWFCFLRAFFALKPDNGDRKLFKACTARSKWPKKEAREAWLIIGTRGGKSFITALLATFLSVFREYQLSPGEKGFVLVVSPTKKQSNLVKRYLSSFFNDNEFLSPYLVRETSEEIELTNNVIIAVLSSDYRTLRGYTAIAAIIDEIAYLTIEGSKPDTEVVRALRSRLMTTKGPLICISSPYAKRGSLYQTFKRHYGKNDSRILVWQASSLRMNVTLDAEAIDQAYEEDPEGSKADYGAQFRSDIETYISREIIESVMVPGRFELPPIPGTRYSAFVDPSGGSNDSMSLAIAHSERGLRVLDLLREVKPPFSPDQVVEGFCKELEAYRITTVTGDRYGGEWPRERFRAHGVVYIVSEKAKSDVYKELLPLLNSARVELLDNETLTNQLVNLERRTSRGGRDSIDHGPGGHDDIANAAAGALVMQAERCYFADSDLS